MGILKGDLQKVCSGLSLPGAGLCVFGHLVERRRNVFPSFACTRRGYNVVSKRSSQQLCLLSWKRLNPRIIPGRRVGHASVFARANAKGNISMLGYLGILQVASATAGSTQRYRSSRFPALSSDPGRHLQAGPVPVHVPVHESVPAS